MGWSAGVAASNIFRSSSAVSLRRFWGRKVVNALATPVMNFGFDMLGFVRVLWCQRRCGVAGFVRDC